MSSPAALISSLQSLATERKNYPKFWMTGGDETNKPPYPSCLSFTLSAATDTFTDILESTPYTTTAAAADLVKSIFDSVLGAIYIPQKLDVKLTQFYGQFEPGYTVLGNVTPIIRMPVEMGKRLKDTGVQGAIRKTIYMQVLFGYVKTPLNLSQENRGRWYGEYCKGMD